MLADEKQFFYGDVLTCEKTLADYSRDYSVFCVKPGNWNSAYCFFSARTKLSRSSKKSFVVG